MTTSNLIGWFPATFVLLRNRTINNIRMSVMANDFLLF